MVLSYEPCGPASALFAKPLTKVPYEGRTHFASGAGKSRTALLQKLRPRVLKLQANLSPKLSLSSGRMGKYLALGHGARTIYSAVESE